MRKERKCAESLIRGGRIPIAWALTAFLLAAVSPNAIGQSIGPEEGYFSVKDYGATGDGATDDTAAFQAALDAAGPVGGWVLVPPVGVGKGYVLTRTVTVPEGVALIGAPAGVGSNVRAVFSLPDTHILGAKIFARPAPDQYSSASKAPLFSLTCGSTVRGFWIMYDEQPMPSDEEFQDPASPYHYASFEEARTRFIPDHVKPYGPAFYAAHGVNIVIEDIVCDRYYDFIYFATSGKCHINRVTMHGFKRGIAMGVARDVNHVSNVEYVPNVGPLSPGGPFHTGKTYTWVYGIMVTDPGNVGIHLGAVDGYSLTDVTFFSIHTGLRLGYSEDYPMFDPVAGANLAPLAPGGGPWGDIVIYKVDQCVVGIHFVTPTHLSNRVVNALIFTGYDDRVDFPAQAGTGDLTNVGKQAAFLVEKTYSKVGNANFMPTFLCSNTIIASFQDSGRFAPASAQCITANGRVFLLDGEILMELSGLQINAPYDTQWLWATGPNAGQNRIRARGVIFRFEAADDLDIETGATPGATETWWPVSGLGKAPIGG